MYIIKVVSGGKRRSGSTLGKQDWGVYGSFLLSIYPLSSSKIQIFLFSFHNILLPLSLLLHSSFPSWTKTAQAWQN